MFEYLAKRIGNKWLRYNLFALFLSLFITLVITLVFFLSSSKNIRFIDLLVTFIHSACISFSISNLIQFVHCFNWFQKQKPTVKNRIMLLPMVLGMFIGFTMASYFQTLIEGKEFLFKETFSNISYFPFIMGLSIGFVAMIYGSLKTEMKTKLQEKETQIAKLNEQNMQSQLQSLQAKINPHFLYNALNSIASLIHESPDKAEDMTLNLSNFFRYSINKNEDHWSTLKEEMEMLDTYLNIERLRFEDRLKINLVIPASLAEVKIPKFLLQPLVENSIKHGISKLSQNAIIDVSVKEVDGKIEISVHDNGPAFPKDLIMGYGLKSLYDKLNLLYGEKYEIEIKNEPRKEIKIKLVQ